MSLKINVPESAWSEQSVSLNGINYRFVFTFNGRDERWRLSIYIGNTAVIEGLKILENQALLGQYLLDDFNHGELFCFRMKEDGLPVGRNNFGLGKAYELVYYSNEEILNG